MLEPLKAEEAKIWLGEIILDLILGWHVPSTSHSNTTEQNIFTALCCQREEHTPTLQRSQPGKMWGWQETKAEGLVDVAEGTVLVLLPGRA